MILYAHHITIVKTRRTKQIYITIDPEQLILHTKSKNYARSKNTQVQFDQIEAYLSGFSKKFQKSAINGFCPNNSGFFQMKHSNKDC